MDQCNYEYFYYNKESTFITDLVYYSFITILCTIPLLHILCTVL